MSDWRQMLKDCLGWHIGELMGVVGCLRRQLAAATAERDALRGVVEALAAQGVQVETPGGAA